MYTLNQILSYIYKSLKILFIILGSLFVLTLIIFLINFNSWQSIIKNSYSARDNLYSSLYSLLDSDLNKAQEQAQIAQYNFKQTSADIENIKNTNPFFSLPFLRKEINNLKRHSQTGELLSNSFLSASDLIYQLEDTVKVFNRPGSFTLEDRKNLIAFGFEHEPELAGLKANLDLALYNLDKIENSFFTLPIENEITKLKTQLNETEVLLARALPILRLLPTLGGWPESSHFLILFQNNDELRPTGGFIGSLATLEVSDLGENIDMQVSDVYHYDMPSIKHLETNPPEPIARYMGLKNWYLRDSNWSPDFPTSAKFIEQLFYQESSYADKQFHDLDAIFAVTPQFVAKLIELTGPIELDGETYNAKNLQALLQYQTGIGYRDEDIESWDRKDIIQDLAMILKDRLKNISNFQTLELFQILDQAIIKKDLQAYFTNPQNQNLAQSLEVDGKIASVDHDYLMIVDANLAAFKTDAVMRKNWYYKLEKRDNDLIANLYLNYQHDGGFDWRTTRYQSYTRILTPKGSQLLSIENASDLKVEDNNELNKTIIGFYFSVEPSQSKQIKISYKLPDKIKNQVEDNNYKLYLQRQAGSRINSFKFEFLNQPPLTNKLENDKLIRIFK